MVFVIGLDGGWSKTTGVLCDHRGVVRAQVRATGSAIVGVPSAEVSGLLDGMIDQLCSEAGVRRSDVAHVGLGLSGIDYADEAIEQYECFCTALNLSAERLTLVNDGLAALWGVSSEPRVALVQHGSGVTTAYRAGPGRERIFDSLDVAGMYDIRRESFARTARMLDGRAPRSILADRILAYCDVPEAAFVEWAFRYPESKVARFGTPKVVFAAWAEGDPAADEMVRLAAADYVLAIRAMAARLGPGSFAAAFGGGVIIEGGPRFADLIHARLAEVCPQAHPTAIRLPPEHGAAVLAASRVGLPFAETFEALAAEAAVAVKA